MIETDITIIGAGVVGLSVTSSISEMLGKESDKNILLIEKHESFGRETSSRSSEVIHASIYYPKNSLKGRFCLEGNEMMYELCKKHNIPHNHSGKLIVAVNDEQAAKLPALLEKAKANGAKGVRIIGEDEIKKIEPKVSAKAAILCPSSGYVDSHSLMQFFEANAIANGADVVYNHEIIAIEKISDGYILKAKDIDGSINAFKTKYMINCAGLGSGHISKLAGIDIEKEGYKINHSKGMYFRVFKGLDRFPQMLIYPSPPEEYAVGIHTTPDTAGGMRLGPYDVWVDDIEYSVDESLKEFFYKSVKPFLPFIELDELHADSAGIHPKVQKQGEGMRDFIIRHEGDKGLENFINLVGIESPGLTSSPAIGKYVAGMLKELLQGE